MMTTVWRRNRSHSLHRTGFLRQTVATVRWVHVTHAILYNEDHLLSAKRCVLFGGELSDEHSIQHSAGQVVALFPCAQFISRFVLSSNLLLLTLTSIKGLPMVRTTTRL